MSDLKDLARNAVKASEGEAPQVVLVEAIVQRGETINLEALRLKEEFRGSSLLKRLSQGGRPEIRACLKEYGLGSLTSRLAALAPSDADIQAAAAIVGQAEARANAETVVKRREVPSK